MKRAVLVAFLVYATPLAGQVVATTNRGVVVAHDGVVELYDARLQRTWSAPGLDRVTRIVTGDDRIALLDAWGNQARIVQLADGSGRTLPTKETPIDGVIHRRDLIVIERDARTVSRLGAESVSVAADPSFIGLSHDRLYVYSRAAGVLQELDARSGLRAVRIGSVPPFASDMELSGSTAYLLYPREARVVAVNLETLEWESNAAGGAPIDLTLLKSGTALSAPLIAIADPAAKRVWTTEGAQSVGAAFGRGFLRGLMGLGLFRVRSSEFPTGIDRVVSADGVTAVYDSSSRTLYRVGGGKSRAIAEDVSPQAFAVHGGRIVFWRDGALFRAA